MKNKKLRLKTNILYIIILLLIFTSFVINGLSINYYLQSFLISVVYAIILAIVNIIYKRL